MLQQIGLFTSVSEVEVEVEGAGLVPWAGGPRMLLLGLPKRSIPKPDQDTENILYNKSR